MLGLYVHVPFCSAICGYCNFNRSLLDDDQKRRFVRALTSELSHLPRQLDSSAAAVWTADTIYFGGGTPSLLTSDEVVAILSACRQNYAVAPQAEITLEANPESVTPERLAGLRRAGVNRLSFGVQSFRNEELRRLDRLHDAARAADAVREARAAGFDNVSLDLMMWLPGQSVEQWLESVDRAIALAPDHISLYILEVYPHLPLRQNMTTHGWIQVDDEGAAEMYDSAMELLERSGYRQYEISNVARDGKTSRHNLKYWTDGQWLGFGPGAHSTWGGARWRNLSSIEEYIARVDAGEIPWTDRRVLTPEERLGDALFTGLRLNEGIDLDVIDRRYDTDVWQRYGSALEDFQEAGLLVIDRQQIRLTRHGMLLANEVMSIFV